MVLLLDSALPTGVLLDCGGFGSSRGEYWVYLPTVIFGVYFSMRGEKEVCCSLPSMELLRNELKILPRAGEVDFPGEV